MVSPSEDNRGWIAPIALGNFTATGWAFGFWPLDQCKTTVRSASVTSAASIRRFIGAPRIDLFQC